MTTKIATQNRRELLGQTALFLMIAVFIVTNDPLFKDLYWLWDYEILTATRLCRYIFPVLAAAAFCFCLYKKRGHCNYGALLLILFVYSGYFISTALNELSLQRPINMVTYQLVMFMAAAVLCSNEKLRKLYIRAYADIFLFFAAVNLFFMFVFIRLWPEFAYLNGAETFIIPAHNQCGFVLLTGMLFCMLDAHFGGRTEQLKMYAYFCLYLVNIYAVHSATAYVGAAIITVYILVPFIRRLFEKIPFWLIIAFNAVFFILMMFFFEDFVNLPPVAFLVKKVLHKTLTFSGRTVLWHGIMEEVKLNPIVGYGMRGVSFFFDDIYNHHTVHCHNQYLQAWHEAGILGLAAPLVMLAAASVKLRKCRDKKLAGIFSAVLFTMLFTLQTDQLTTCPWYIVLLAVHLVFLLCPNTESEPAVNHKTE